MLDFVHIGYHKTGTSWLQKYWFPSQPSFLMLERILGDDFMPFFKWFFNYRANPPESDSWEKAIGQGRMREQALCQQQLIAGWSNEGLSGDIFQGGGEFIANRLYEIFGKIKVIIGIRNQFAMLNSTYKHYIKIGGRLTPSEFLRKPSIKNGLINRLKYDKLIYHYVQLFDADNIYVYLYEEFVRDKKASLDKLASFIGSKSSIIPHNRRENASLSPLSTSILRFANRYCSNINITDEGGAPRFSHETRNRFRHFIGAADVRLLRLFSRKTIFPMKSNKDELQSIFCSSNRNLELLIKRDLAAHGYP